MVRRRLHADHNGSDVRTLLAHATTNLNEGLLEHPVPRYSTVDLETLLVLLRARERGLFII